MPPDSSETAGVAVRCCSIPMNSNMKRLVPHEGPAFFSLREILQNIWFSLLAIVSCNAILLFPFSTSGPRLFPAIKQERRQYSGPGILSLKYNREFCLKFPAFTKSRCRGIISIVDAHGSVIILIHAELALTPSEAPYSGSFSVTEGPANHVVLASPLPRPYRLDSVLYSNCVSIPMSQ